MRIRRVPLVVAGLAVAEGLAVHPDWTLAVQVKYPGKLGLTYGAKVGQSVTQQLVYQPTSAEG